MVPLPSSIISIRDLDKEQVESILKYAKFLKENPQRDLLKNLLLGCCFFESSTRTRLSFETAIKTMGGDVIGFSDSKSTSTSKGESFIDAIKTIAQYVDMIVVRHFQEGSARLASEVSPVPVINAGDGSNQHPTQALLDLFTMQEYFSRLEGLHIGICGDLLYGRTVHSLAQICSLFNMRLYFIAPQSLQVPESICDDLRKQEIKFSFHYELNDVISHLDVLYMTRLQKERLPNPEQLPSFENCHLLPSLLEQAKPEMKVLHPLPHGKEISPLIDKTSHAVYFEQVKNGIYIRQALLSLLLNKTHNIENTPTLSLCYD